MTEGILFGDKHTWRDWEMYLKSYYISMPMPKRNQLNLPGANGVIDLSDYPGGTTYENRAIVAELEFEDGSYAGMMAKATMIAEAIQGKRLHVVFDDNADFYYVGRCMADITKINEMVSGITITVDAEPYKYENNVGDDWLWNDLNFDSGIIREYRNLAVAGSLTVRIIGRPMKAIPIIEVSAAMQVECQGTVYQLRAGRNKIYEISIGEGEHSLIFRGNGTVSIEYIGGII